MEKSMKHILALIIVLATLFAFKADEDFLKILLSKLETYNQNFGEEKVYLQIDKTLYKPGEDIWFNAFVLDGKNHTPTGKSNVLYVELIDPKGNQLKKLELLIEEGTTHGDFSIGTQGPGGVYIVRAYTQWMKNFSEDNFYTKEIQVQKIITPRLLLKLDFEKKAYGKNDTVTAILKARGIKDEPLARAQVKSKMKLDGKEVESKTFITNEKGEATITFRLPPDLITTDGLLQNVVSADGIEESISKSVPIVLNQIKINFFPEGGDIVQGNKSTVAFKAVNEFGKGADISGIILDENGQTVSSFKSFHFGMGSFELMANENKKYVCKITQPEGIDQLFELPISQSQGISLQLKSQSDSTVEFNIFSTQATEVFIVGHAHSNIFFSEKVVVRKGTNQLQASTKDAPAGIAVFTLFNANGEETSERLVNINSKKKIKINLTTNRKEYQPGEKVELTLKSTDDTGNPTRGKFSLAVVDDQLITTVNDKQDNLLSWMLLSSELKGKIEEPSFYFDENEPKSQQALNYLLMVHGWRRFSWKEVFENTKTVSFLPENEKSISGLVVDKANKNTKAEVILIELANRKRIAKVKSTDAGQFLFQNVDASTPLLIVTKRPNTVEVGGAKSTNVSDSHYRYNTYQSDWIEPVLEIEDKNFITVSDKHKIEEVEQNIDLSSDVAQLSEVVVVGYGTSAEKKSLGASVVSIQNQAELNKNLSIGSIENLLNGRIAGIQITPSSASGASTRIQIRGMNTLGNSAEPLWVVDGVPMSASVNTNFSIGSQLSAENISTIYVVKSPEATALFGSAAANGAILIETKTKPWYSDFRYVKRGSKYSALTIQPRKFSKVREFYSEPSKKKTTRTDENTTVFWKHTVVTNDKGEAKVEFFNNDKISTFRITAEGINGKGLLGRAEATYHTALPFSIDAKIPNYLGYEDTLKLPVRITNNTKSTLSGKLTITLPNQLGTTQELKQPVEVSEGKSIIVPITIFTKGVSGKFPISLKIESGNYVDEVKGILSVHPIGFPVQISYAGKSLSKTLTVDIKDLEKGSLSGELVFVTDVLQDLFMGAEGMLQEPHGCFEQVSSSTFPNILALQLLKETKTANKEVEQQALNYIKDGYSRLVGYEVKGGGFEWFGKPAAHLCLTAYGLLEFKEMKKIYPTVDDKMIQRTAEWLLSRRKGDGTFLKPNDGYDGFSHAPVTVANAYVVYAFSEAEFGGVEKEYEWSLREAMESKDMYRCALMANAAINNKKMDDYQKLKSLFIKSVSENGFSNLKIESSIVRSYGNSLTNETIALWALALMKAPSPEYKLIKECIDFVGSKKSFGTYGSTQATYLSLKAITEYHKLVQSVRTSGQITVSVAGANPEIKPYQKDAKENIVFKNFANYLKQGGNKVQVNFGQTNEPLPCSFNLQYTTKTPVSHSDCKLKIETRLAQPEVKWNETVRLSIRLTNTSSTGLPMSMAIIGIPAGLNLQPWQLKELQEKSVFDFYELIGDKLAIYYREMNGNQTRTTHLDLKADLPGTFQSSASCAYLYYANEYKHWVSGTKVKINN
jgi:alpha-2-macroglobulin-like protein